MTERPLTAQEATEFAHCRATAHDLLGLDDGGTPLTVVQAVEDYVLAWHRPPRSLLARPFRRRPDTVQAALALGALWGEQLVRAFGWHWTCHLSDGRELYAVASPDRALAIYPTYFIKACLDDPARDCTVVLAFNLLAASGLPPQPPGGFLDVMAAVYRVVPRG